LSAIEEICDVFALFDHFPGEALAADVEYAGKMRLSGFRIFAGKTESRPFAVLGATQRSDLVIPRIDTDAAVESLLGLRTF
jgi:hypothetical protein